MSAVDGAILAVWLIVAVLVYRAAYVRLDGWSRSQYRSKGPLGGDERGLNALLAAVIGIAWPLTGSALIAWRLLTPTTPGEQADALAEREYEVRERERRIAELERLNRIEGGT